MIYLDNAATTLQKPASVWRAMAQTVGCCGNPGRSGHRAAMRAAGIVYDCRCAAAELFGLAQPEGVVFTLNATHALNIAIKSCLRSGGHAVISGYEHNSVVRPLEGMEGVTYTVARSPLFEPEAVCGAVADAITAQTRCVILSHVSNVFGFVQPVEQVDALCRERGIPLVIDASQSAGTLPLKASDLPGTAFVCMPGHKGLYGPQGSGILLCCKDIPLYTVLEGGTGSASLERRQPDFLPDALESGTLNVPGIAGLREGLRLVTNRGAEIVQREQALLSQAAEALGSIPGVRLWYGPRCQCGVLSFRLEGWDPTTLGAAMAREGFCLRPGLHCAPLAHETAGTLPEGTLRAGFSLFNTAEEVTLLIRQVEKLAKCPPDTKNKCFGY